MYNFHKSSHAVLVIASLVMVLLLLQHRIVVVLARSVREAPPSGEHNETDMSSDWAREIIRLAKAADIKAVMDAHANPCDNFFKYACGKWHHSNPAQLLNDIMTDRFQMLTKAFDRRLERVLQQRGNVSDPLQRNVREFYEACREVRNDDVQYALSVENVYKEFGEFPALVGDTWNATSFMWWEAAAKIHHKYGKQIILAVDILGDMKNNTKNRIYLGPPEFSTSIHSKILSILEEASVAQQLEESLGLSSKMAAKTAKEIIEFEREIKSCGTDARKGVQVEVFHEVQALSENYAEYIDIAKYLELVLGAQPPETIYVYDEKYLAQVLQVVQGKPSRIVANYVLWQLLEDFLVSWTERDLSKWCMKQTKKYFGKYIDHLVYGSYRSNQTEAEVHQIFEEIRNVFRSDLKGDKLDWITPKTRAYAVEKLDAMTLEINSYDNEDFALLYGDLQFHRLTYVEMVQQLLMHESRRNIAQLNETGSTLSPTDVLSFTPVYSLQENNIKIPVSLLQPRYFWGDEYPQALKYSSLGSLIGHEMIHGFDDDGRKYDKLGNQNDWWDAKSEYEFQERRKCFQGQYHNYRYADRQLPDSVAQAENIADNAAIKLAFKAYERWLEKQRNQDTSDIDAKETLPGLPLDNRQLFFLTYAQVWCDDVQTLFKSTVALGDLHAPPMYRIVGSLSNFQEFSWVFQCPQNASMDPEFKCSIY